MTLAMALRERGGCLNQRLRAPSASHWVKPDNESNHCRAFRNLKYGDYR